MREEIKPVSKIEEKEELEVEEREIESDEVKEFKGLLKDIKSLSSKKEISEDDKKSFKETYTKSLKTAEKWMKILRPDQPWFANNIKLLINYFNALSESPHISEELRPFFKEIADLLRNYDKERIARLIIEYGGNDDAKLIISSFLELRKRITRVNVIEPRIRELKRLLKERMGFSEELESLESELKELKIKRFTLYAKEFARLILELPIEGKDLNQRQTEILEKLAKDLSVSDEEFSEIQEIAAELADKIVEIEEELKKRGKELMLQIYRRNFNLPIASEIPQKTFAELTQDVSNYFNDLFI